MGIAAMASLPMYLNTRNPKINSIRDITAANKIAVIAVKVSAYALVLQMAARKDMGSASTFDLDKYTVSLPHSNGVAALLSDGQEIDLHFTGPPFSDIELKDPRIRTILNSDDVMGGSTSFTVLYTTKKFHGATARRGGDKTGDGRPTCSLGRAVEEAPSRRGYLDRGVGN